MEQSVEVSDTVQPAAPQPASNEMHIESTAEIEEKVDNDDHQEIMTRYETAYKFWEPIFAVGLDDDKFINGEQWDPKIKADREDEGRPCFTFNRMPSFIDQTVGDQRKNRPGLKIAAAQADQDTKNKRIKNLTGSRDYSYAEVYNGIAKNIERASNADQAYDTAFEHSVSHGFGFALITNIYSTDDCFLQDIAYRRIKNSYRVLMDPGFQEADSSDKKYTFIFDDVDLAYYKKRYPEASVEPIGQLMTGTNMEDWFRGDTIRIADYYYLEPYKATLYQMSDGNVYDSEKAAPVLDELAKQGITVAKQRDVYRNKCMWRKINGNETIEGPSEVPCDLVPILFFSGKERLVDGMVVYHSLIRHGKDGQIAYNYWRTAAIELGALAPKIPYILTAKMIEGHEDMWKDANKKNLPYLLINSDDKAPGWPQRQMQSNNIVSEMAQANASNDDMHRTIGLFEPSVGEEDSKHRSGKALLALQNKGDTGTYAFVDNHARAIQLGGKILIKMIPRVIDSERIIRIVLPDGKEDFVEVNKTIKDEQSGQDIILNDLSYGKYDSVVTIGPSHASQRMEAAERLLELLRILPPEQATIVTPIFVKNLDFPGADEIYHALKKTLPKEFQDPEDSMPEGYVMGPNGVPVNQQSGEPLPPTPQEQLAELKFKAEIATAEGELAQADATKAKAQADTAEAQVKMADVQNRAAFQPEQFIKQVMEIIEEHSEESSAKAIVAAMPQIIQEMKAAFSQPAA